jgi:hypothetical protein
VRHTYLHIAAWTVGLLLLASTAQAVPISVSSSGGVLDGWNVTPFSVTGYTTPQVVNGAGYTAYLQNNIAPINYPSSGHVPSPGGSTGEKFDLEEMYVKQIGYQLQFLLVASSSFSATASGSTFKLGDLMLDFGANGTWDAGVVTQASNGGLVQGGFYDGITTQGLQHLSGGYYANAAVAAAVGPWALGSGTLLGTSALRTGSFSYTAAGLSGQEGATYLYEYDVDLSNYPGDIPDAIKFQMAWGCGNDMLGGTFNLDFPEPQNDVIVPEPLTAGLGMTGLLALSLGLLRRRPRR